MAIDLGVVDLGAGKFLRDGHILPLNLKIVLLFFPLCPALLRDNSLS